MNAQFTKDNWDGTVDEIGAANNAFDRWFDANEEADEQAVKTACDLINNAFNGVDDSADAIYRRAFGD